MSEEKHLHDNKPQTDVRSELILRPAREGDTLDVLELTKDIWGGDDYVPYVWSEWLADPEGRLAVAEYHGKVIGLSKLTRFTPDDWWLHGLRVHPEYQGHGIASALHDYLLGYWLEHGQGALRLATNSARLPVHHLSARTGFEKVGEFTPFRAPAGGGLQPGVFRPLEASAASEALAMARRSPVLDLSWGFMDLGWEWIPPNDAFIAEYASAGRAWWWHPGGQQAQGLLLVMQDEDEETNIPQVVISLIACEQDQLLRLLLDYRLLAGELGYTQAAWVAPLRSEGLPVLEAAGFVRSWDKSVYLFARPHPSRP